MTCAERVIEISSATRKNVSPHCTLKRKVQHRNAWLFSLAGNESWCKVQYVDRSSNAPRGANSFHANAAYMELPNLTMPGRESKLPLWLTEQML